jgi:hypothetical protein
MVADRPWKRLHLLLRSWVALSMSSPQQPMDVQHFKGTAESTMMLVTLLDKGAIKLFGAKVDSKV